MDCLAKYADLHVVCGSVKIPCVKFVAAKKCDVLRWVIEDAPDATDEIPLPNVDPRAVELALRVVHDVASLDRMDISEIDKVLVGYDILGCDPADALAALWTKLVHVDDVVQRLAKLIRSEAKKDVLHFVVGADPHFAHVKRVIKACEPDMEVAVFLMEALVKTFPVNALFRAIVAALPEKTLTFERALDIAGADGVEVYAHPREAAAIASYVRHGFPAENSSAMRFLKMVHGATHCYDAAPSPEVHGTVVSFSDSRNVSAFVELYKIPRKPVKIASWLTLDVRRDQIDAVLRANAIDDQVAKSAKFFDVRVFVDVGGTIADLWYSWAANEHGWTPRSKVRLSACRNVRGDVDKMSQAIRNGLTYLPMRTLRIDAFFSAEAPVHKAFPF